MLEDLELKHVIVDGFVRCYEETPEQVLMDDALVTIGEATGTRSIQSAGLQSALLREGRVLDLLGISLAPL